MIALQLSLLLISMVYLSYLFASSLMIKWQRKVEIENQLSVISRDMSVKINSIRELLNAGPHDITAINNSGDTLNISLHPVLKLNRHTFGNENIKYKEGNFRYYIKSQSDGNDITITEGPNLTHKYLAIGVEFNLKFIIFNRMYQLKSTVYLQMLNNISF